ncbi:SH3 domain-containing protein [Pseudomonas sp.]|nr:SH3 domain-containing protein [Pseudomonas sp.]
MNEMVDERTSPSGSNGDPISGDQMRQLAKQAKVFGDSAQLKQLAEQANAFGDSAQLKQFAEQARAFDGSAQLKQIAEQAKAFGSSAQLKQIAEQARAFDGSAQAFGDSAQLKQIAEQARAFGGSAQLKQIAEQAKAFGDSAQLKQIAEQARAFGGSAQLKQIAEQAKAFGDSAQLKQIAEQAKAWSNNIHLSRFAQQTLPASLTFDVLVGELVARSNKNEDVHGSAGRPGTVVAGTENTVSTAELFTVEIYPDTSTWRKFSEIPTWLLYLWLICIAPMLTVLANWEAIRTGLVDINARMPQTHSFANLRRFISSNLAGKPGDVRLVTGSSVRLRVAPGMKSDVILTLPKYAPVVVLGKEDRTWLYVRYEHEGFLVDGYVSTKFLKKIRK